MLRLCLFAALIAGVCVTTVAGNRAGFMSGYMTSAMDSLNNVSSLFSNIETAVEGVMGNN